MTGGTKGATARRVLALWLPHLSAERPESDGGRDRTVPFAVWIPVGNRQIVTAANAAGARAGIVPGQSLSDARAIVAGLMTAPADAQADRRTLIRLAAWCRRYAPWTAPAALGAANSMKGGSAAAALGAANSMKGGSAAALGAANSMKGGSAAADHGPALWLDVAGCAHLFGGEEALCRAVVADLARAGFTARAGLAGTPGAAWALAHCANPAAAVLGTANSMKGGSAAAPVIAPIGGDAAMLAPLPVAALRLDDTTVEGLSALGLRRIGDLYPLMADALGRASLARRFPLHLLDRLDAALGHVFEPISPVPPRARHLTRFLAPEPVHDGAAVARILARLADALAPLLAREGLGARQIALAAFRADGRRARLAVGTARPVADARTLAALLGFRLTGLDLGPGADAFTLEAVTVEPLRAVQGQLGAAAAPSAANSMEGGYAATARAASEDLAPLIEKLAAKLGEDRVGHLVARPNHLPERAQGFESALAASATTADDVPAITPARPPRLLVRPEAVAARSAMPDGPPAWFRWRGTQHRIARAEGPERIALDWWRQGDWQADGGGAPAGMTEGLRDYWRVEDLGGERFWLYRDGPWRADGPERWFLHGFFP